MIKKDLKLFVNVGENSLALRKLMAEHLESMGIDGAYAARARAYAYAADAYNKKWAEIEKLFIKHFGGQK